MSSNWKNPFLNKDKLNIPQNEKEDGNLDLDNNSDLKKHSKNTYAIDMR